MQTVSRRKFLTITAMAVAGTALPKCISADKTLQKAIVIGDLHLGRDTPKEKIDVLISSLKTLVDVEEKLPLIFNGDIVEIPNQKETCSNAEWMWEKFGELYLSLEKMGFEQHLVFGNHDGTIQNAMKVLKGMVPEKRIGNFSFELDRDTRAVALSAIHPNRLSAEFLESEILASENKKLVLFTHFPPDAISYVPGNENLPSYSLWRNKKMIEIISEMKIPLICSHSHAPFTGEYVSKELPNPIKIISTPSVTYPLAYLGEKKPVKRVFGITILHFRKKMEPVIYDRTKKFHRKYPTIQSKKGKYLPLKLAKN